MQSLRKTIIKSNLGNVEIQYGNELIKFNLPYELKIHGEEFINDDLKQQSTLYGFLLMLHKKLLTSFEHAKTERKRTFGVLMFKAKEEKLNGRPLSDDLSKAWVEKHIKYIKATKHCIEIKDNADTIYSCVKAFEQRKDLMQTLSSNTRKG